MNPTENAIPTNAFVCLWIEKGELELDLERGERGERMRGRTRARDRLDSVEISEIMAIDI